jgi:hypothetical protein
MHLPHLSTAFSAGHFSPDLWTAPSWYGFSMRMKVLDYSPRRDPYNSQHDSARESTFSRIDSLIELGIWFFLGTAHQAPA